MKIKSLTVFFPCYNEEANVERTTLAALKTCRRLGIDFEIIIVNDGSRDKTGEIADRLAKDHPGVRAVHNRPNRGYGGALQRGFREATKDWIFYTDGDGQFDFDEIDTLFPLLEKYDIASAYRMDRKDPLIRKLNAFCWSLLVNALFRIGLRDIDCAFKIYPRFFIQQIEMKSQGALIDTEMLARARRLGYTIGQVGVHHYSRTAGQQTGANLKVIARAFMELLKLRRDINQTSVVAGHSDAACPVEQSSGTTDYNGIRLRAENGLGIVPAQGEASTTTGWSASKPTNTRMSR